MARVSNVFDLFNDRGKVKGLPPRLKWGIGVEITDRGQRHLLLGSFPRRGAKLGRVLVADTQGNLQGGVVLGHHAPCTADRVQTALQATLPGQAELTARDFGLEEETQLCWLVNGLPQTAHQVYSWAGGKFDDRFFAANDRAITQQTLAGLWKEVAENMPAGFRLDKENKAQLYTLREGKWKKLRAALTEGLVPVAPFAALLGPGELVPLTRAFWEIAAPPTAVAPEPVVEAKQTQKKEEAQWVTPDCPAELRDYLTAIYTRENFYRGLAPSDKVVFECEERDFPVKLPARMPMIAKKVIFDPTLVEYGYDYLQLLKILNQFFSLRDSGFEKVSPGLGIDMASMAKATVEIYVGQAGIEGKKEPRVHFSFVLSEPLGEIEYVPQPEEFVRSVFNWRYLFEQQAGGFVPRKGIEKLLETCGYFTERECRSKLEEFPKQPGPVIEVYYLLRPELAAKASR